MIPLHDDNPTTRRAIVTILLIAVNVAIYFGVQFPKHGQAEVRFEYRWATVPCEIATGHPIVAIPDGTASAPHSCVVAATGLDRPQPVAADKNVWLALAIAMFLHASVIHLLGNMLFLWVFGNNVEDQLGHFWYLVLYLVGGLVASLVFVGGNLHSTSPVLGASGAIAVIMGAYIVWFPRARVLTLVVIIPVKLPAAVMLGFWFVLQFFTQSASRVATLAHIGGFAFGMLVAYSLRRTRGFPRRRAPAIV